MGGLGPEEVRALNRAAVGYRAGATLGGHMPFRAGDRVVVLKHRAGLPAYGTFGTVTDTWGDRSGPTGARFLWADGSETVTADRRALAGVGWGYAVTPWLAARRAGPLMVLGPAAALGRARERVVMEMTPERGWEGLARTGRGLGWSR